MQHAQHYGILSEFQHDFRPGYSCQTQVIDFIENIQHAMDQQQQVDLFLLRHLTRFPTNVYTYQISTLWNSR